MPDFKLDANGLTIQHNADELNAMPPPPPPPPKNNNFCLVFNTPKNVIIMHIYTAV